MSFAVPFYIFFVQNVYITSAESTDLLLPGNKKHIKPSWCIL